MYDLFLTVVILLKRNALYCYLSEKRQKQGEKLFSPYF